MKMMVRFFECAAQSRKGARPRAPRQSAALLAFCFLLLACTISAASAADLALDGRWLNAENNVVSNASVSAMMNVYTNDAADAVALTNAPVTLATDADGFFRTVATNLSLPSGCQTYWLGVTPQGGAEIAPRMKVSPAPFAFHAAEARLLEADDLRVDGTVTIGRLTNSTATAGTVAVTDNLVSHGIGGVNQLYLGGIDLTGGGRLALFRTEWSGTLYVTQGGMEGHRQTSAFPDDDGILWVRVTIVGQDNGSCSPVLWITDGKTGARIDVRKSKWTTSVDSDRSYFFMLPVRGGGFYQIDAEMWDPIGRDMAIHVDYRFYAAGIK